MPESERSVSIEYVADFQPSSIRRQRRTKTEREKEEEENSDPIQIEHYFAISS